MQYYRGEITREQLDERFNEMLVCIESDQLRNWKTLAGRHHNGPRKGMAMRLLYAKKNSLAVLTTRFPQEKEKDRVIYAVFLVEDYYEGNDREDGIVEAEPKYRLSLNLEECKQMPFWKYFANEKQPEKPAWSTGLFRYISDNESAQILKDIAKIKKGTKDEALAAEFLTEYCSLHDIDAGYISTSSGALTR